MRQTTVETGSRAIFACLTRKVTHFNVRAPSRLRTMHLSVPLRHFFAGSYSGSYLLCGYVYNYYRNSAIVDVPGGPRGLLPQGSHKSVRAQLRHTARQVTVSLRAGKLSGLSVVSKAGMLSRSPASGPSLEVGWNVVPTTCAKCV